MARSGDRPQPAPYLGDDNAYALACDNLGRIWVGHLNHGVSVFNGKEWRNYDVLTGPLGERVFDIATCPADGDVWIATNAGLARYRLERGGWSYYTRADGLPADDVQCLAFDKQGTLYAGTQCDGLAIGRPARVRGQLEYRRWRVVTARRLKTSEVSGAWPIVPCGEGLPADLLNDLLAARDGTVYAATVTGLAASRDQGRTWQFLRGQNWQPKARGLYRPPPKEQLDAAAKLAKDRTLLLEDYVTCLAEDEAGNLWIGHREKGHEVFDPRTGKRLGAGQPSGPKKGTNKGRTPDYVTGLLCYRGEFLAGTYGAGLDRLSPLPHAGEGPGVRASNSPGGNPARPAPLPAPAKPPTADELHDLVAQWSKPAPAPRRKSPLVIALPDDWRTQGDWLGRYGRYWACLAGMRSPYNLIFPQEGILDYREQMGANCREEDSLRYWVHWLYTNDRRCLEMPPRYLNSRIEAGFTTRARPRRQAEWDDHGETYPMTMEGPHIFVRVEVPEGWHLLSLYFINKDGHTGRNRWRDYGLEVRGECQIGWRHRHTANASEMATYYAIPLLARGRVRDFWSGVYKRFLLRGPGWYTIKIDRNHSFNTICSSVMLDRLESP